MSAELFDTLRDTLRRYVVFPAHGTDAAALWIAATHCLPAFQFAPRLVLTSPEKRCGKTRLLDVIDGTCHDPLATSNATVAAVFRSLDKKHPPTLLIDEADAIFGSKRTAEQHEDLRALLNAGHERGRPALRCSGPLQTPTRYPTFAMAALAGIGAMPETITDRAVNLTMRRRAVGERVAQFRARRDGPILAKLRDCLTAWGAEHHDELTDAEPDMPVTDRAADTWEPLIAIADAAGGHWPTTARAACVALVRAAETADEDRSHGVRLLSDIRQIFDDRGRAFLPSLDLVLALCRVEESPWDDYELTPRKLAVRLQEFGVGITRPTCRVRQWRRRSTPARSARPRRSARRRPRWRSCRRPRGARARRGGSTRSWLGAAPLCVRRARVGSYPGKLAAVANREARAVNSAGRLSPLGYHDEQLRRAFDTINRGETAVLETRDPGFTSATGLIPPELGPILPVFPRHEDRLLDRLPGVAIDVPAIAYIEVVSVSGGPIGVTAEGAAKPELLMPADAKQATARTIAAHVGVSWQAYSGDYPAFVTAVQVELMKNIVDGENAQLYGGTGESNGQVNGLLTNPNILTLAAGTGGTENFTDLSAGIAALRNGPALAECNLILMHPETWSAIRVQKDSYGRFLIQPDPAADQANTVFGVDVLQSTTFTPGEAVCCSTPRFTGGRSSASRSSPG
jgi:hypothetical protein